MKILLQKNVFDAALERINYLFDEFPNIICQMSGGKDSTVCYNLTLKVARERNRLPLNVLFIDQEAEWDCVIDYIRTIMNNPDIKPYWLQMPIRIFNVTSPTERWLWCWKEGAQWLREKEEMSYKENNYGTDRFKELFAAFSRAHFHDQKTAFIGGVRVEESPQRAIGLTTMANYKHITWGNKANSALGHYGFYPLYDWTYRDIWKAIHDNHWDYCKLYDYMYMYGTKIQAMRVSNVNHETAIRSLYMMQEIEPENWKRLTSRLQGINTAAQGQNDLFSPPKKLPYMFKDWREYRDYLLENLITDIEIRATFKKRFDYEETQWCHGNKLIEDEMLRMMVAEVVANDYHMTKFLAWRTRPDTSQWRKWKLKGIRTNNLPNKYIDYELARS